MFVDNTSTWATRLYRSSELEISEQTPSRRMDRLTPYQAKILRLSVYFTSAFAGLFLFGTLFFDLPWWAALVALIAGFWAFDGAEAVHYAKRLFGSDTRAQSKAPIATVTFDKDDVLLVALVAKLAKMGKGYVTPEAFAIQHDPSDCDADCFSGYHRYSVWKYVGAKQRELLSKHQALVDDYLADPQLREALELHDTLDGEEDAERREALMGIIDGAAASTLHRIEQEEEIRTLPERMEQEAIEGAAREQADRLIANPPLFYTAA